MLLKVSIYWLCFHAPITCDMCIEMFLKLIFLLFPFLQRRTILFTILKICNFLDFQNASLTLFCTHQHAANILYHQKVETLDSRNFYHFVTSLMSSKTSMADSKVWSWSDINVKMTCHGTSFSLFRILGVQCHFVMSRLPV